MGGRGRRGGRGDQPRGPERQLPLRREEPPRRSSTRASTRRAWWGRRSPGPRGRPGCGCRRARRRSTGTASTRANDEATGELGGGEPGRARHVELQHRRRQGLGADAATRPRRRATRKVALRSAITLSPDRGGIFATLLGLVRAGPRRHVGRRPAVRLVDPRARLRARRRVPARARDDLAGPVNLAAPGAPARTASSCARSARPGACALGLPAPAWLLAIGAFFLRTETELVLKSRRVVPGRLLAAGFSFDYPTWPEAAPELCERARAGTLADRRELRGSVSRAACGRPTDYFGASVMTVPPEVGLLVDAEVELALGVGVDRDGLDRRRSCASSSRPSGSPCLARSSA